MKSRYKLIFALVVAVIFTAWTLPSQAQPCLARQLMTPEEWNQHQVTMRSLAPAERQAYRAKHHQEMKRRAAAMGIMLPDQPPPMGMGRAMGPRAWGPGPGWSRYGGGGRPGWGRGPVGPRYPGWGW